MHIPETEKKLPESRVIGLNPSVLNPFYSLSTVHSTLYSPSALQKGTRSHVEKNLYFDISSWGENKSCWLPWLPRPSGPPFTASEFVWTSSVWLWVEISHCVPWSWCDICEAPEILVFRQLLCSNRFLTGNELEMCWLLDLSVERRVPLLSSVG